MSTERWLLLGVILVGLRSMITVEGQIDLLAQRLAVVELASGLRSPWAGAGAVTRALLLLALLAACAALAPPPTGGGPAILCAPVSRYDGCPRLPLTPSRGITIPRHGTL